MRQCIGLLSCNILLRIVSYKLVFRSLNMFSVRTLRKVATLKLGMLDQWRCRVRSLQMILLIYTIESGATRYNFTSQRNSIVQILYNASPITFIVERDAATGMFPFMLAASSNNACINMIFILLRFCPELYRFYH